MARKRAPGGGAKPKGPVKGKNSALSTRITDDLRKRLDAAAESEGRSLSQEVELRLRESFAERREQDPYLRNLHYIITQTFHWSPGGDMRTDRFRFQIFQYALARLLERLEPAGEVIVPAGFEDHEHLSNPRAVGEIIAMTVWKFLTGTPETSVDQTKGMALERGNVIYGMPQAREALGVDFDAEEWATFLHPDGLAAGIAAKRRRDAAAEEIDPAV